MEKGNGIQILSSVVAGRIAAGEVIDRPASIIREAIDNSIDAGATSVSVSIRDGGISFLSVSDNGKGFSEKDLSVVASSHATSKIRTIDDIYTATTLGFRGEALYSVASAAKLTIESNGKGITIDNGVRGKLFTSGVTTGAVITAENLFSRIPARLAFLKRPQSEALACKNVVLEKAAAFPNVAFKMFSDGKLLADLRSESPKSRVLSLYADDSNWPPAEALELTHEDNNFRLYAVASTPAAGRRDKSKIKIYVNRRPVNDYSLVQAVAYGYAETIPGGLFPYCTLFVEVNPELVDFNIHPAKRECKLRNLSQIHSALTSMIREGVKPKPVRILEEHINEPVQRKFTYPQQPHVSKPEDKGGKWTEWFEAARTISVAQKLEPWEDFRYIGQVLSLFILIEKDDKLIFIDQHAAAERVLFDKLRAGTATQRLMVPTKFEVGRDTDDFLLEHSDIYTKYGIEIDRTDDLLWQLKTVPEVCRDEEKQIIELIRSCAGDAEAIEQKLYASIACHASVKDNGYVDEREGRALAAQVLKMEKPCCPHGRMFITEISKDELKKSVGRF